MSTHKQVAVEITTPKSVQITETLLVQCWRKRLGKQNVKRCFSLIQFNREGGECPDHKGTHGLVTHFVHVMPLLS